MRNPLRRLMRPQSLIGPLVRETVGVACYIFIQKSVEQPLWRWGISGALALMAGIWFPVARMGMSAVGLDNALQQAADQAKSK